MASLRTATPRLRNYFKDNYIPQVCEALLCGILTTCPEDPLRYLEEMIIFIIENGLESLLWDMCIEPSMKPKIRRLSETYMEQLFGLDDQLMTPELMIKACTFYTGHLVKTHFCTWRDVTAAHINGSVISVAKMERAIEHYHLKLQKLIFHLWYSYIKRQKEKLIATLSNLHLMFSTYRQKVFITRWREEVKRRNKIRDDELALKHDLQLKTWRSTLKFKRSEGRDSTDLPELGEYPAFDISLLPERAILQDESMKHISEGCPGVLYLNLSNTTITNKTMRLLPRNFQNLQNLSLAYCRKFTDKGLRYLNLGNGCHKLIYLDLSGCTQISVQGFRNIADSCSGIMHLTINDMPTLTDSCVKVLVEKCLNITSVVFIGSPHISDGTFKALSACSLRKIRFEGNKRITDACFKYIDKNYPNITHIYMVDCKGITDGGLKLLSPLKQLTVLNLANCARIGDMGLKQFLEGPSSTKIRELNLSNCVLLGDSSIVQLAERCTNLNYLSLRNCGHLTDQGLEYIVNIFSLVSVDISGTVICNEGLSILSRHKKLKELSISECYKITDVGIQGFCKNVPFLEYLDVSHCTQLTDNIMKTVAIYCPQLTSLSIAGCPKITDAGIEMLSAKCYYLHILDISGCVLLTDQTLQDLQIGCSQLRILKMKYCSHISMREAQRMSSKVQQQEYSSNDPPHWFGYDSNGKLLTGHHGNLPFKGHSEAKMKDLYSSEDELFDLQTQAEN
ncbi:F-box and leucine-rich repeat protein 13 isoform X5 [Dipodomys merriami]|uniref:F-box and leucine-rich repeat protein 13 isoform X5 n=1 Tax=Dipodomys merriami TaxID=94247 RepID=UPI003855CB89